VFRPISVLACVAVISLGLTVPAPAQRLSDGQPGSPGIGDPYFPLDGNGGYDVQHYDLQLRYQPATDVLTGVADITAHATESLSRFNLDLDGLKVTRVTVGGRSARWSRSRGELTVRPAATLQSGSRFVVEVSYHGIPGTLSYLGGSGFFHTSDGAVVAGEPHGASTWFPVNDHPSDKATYAISVRAPRDLRVVSNGHLESSHVDGAWKTWLWQQNAPMASYLATMAIGNFAEQRRWSDGIKYIDAVDSSLMPSIAPRTGTRYAVSQQADSSYKRLSRVIDVPADGARLGFWISRNTETEFDFAFVEAHTVGKNDWTTLPDVNGHTSRDPGFSCFTWQRIHPFLRHYQTAGGQRGCTSRGTTGVWRAATGSTDHWEHWVVDLDRYAGTSVQVSITYASDNLVQYGGVAVDDIHVSTGQGTTSFESDGNVLDGWTVPGPPRGTDGNANDWIVGDRSEGPASTGQTAMACLDREAEVVKFLAGKFGRYPFTQSGGIVDKTDAQFALETQTRPVYAPAFFTNTFGGASVVAHELAHQWYGDSVSVRWWRNIWLNEGFATYAEWLWSQHEGNGTPYDIFRGWASVPAHATEVWKHKVGNPGRAHLFDYFTVYVRGAMTLEALRLRIGSDDFFHVIQAWVRLKAGGNGTSAQFQRLAEHISGKDLHRFFHQWLFTSGKPPIRKPSKATQAQKTMAMKLLATADAGTSERLSPFWSGRR
jgi:hypothetical protein